MKHEEMRRSQEGTKAGIFGLSCNLILAVAKFFIGTIGNSIIILADGANNLADSISALLTIISFRMEASGEDEMHPYGHGRIEYVTGFLISLMILGTGISVGKEAVMRIFRPETISVSTLAVAVLILSILVKLGIMFYYQKKNKELNSPALDAVRKDSLSDACISILTLAGLCIMPCTNLPLDGILGLMMAVYIFLSGWDGFRENLTLLLGEGANRKTENELREILSECAEIESVEGITIHDYGPDKRLQSQKFTL